MMSERKSPRLYRGGRNQPDQWPSAKRLRGLAIQRRRFSVRYGAPVAIPGFSVAAPTCFRGVPSDRRAIACALSSSMPQHGQWMEVGRDGHRHRPRPRAERLRALGRLPCARPRHLSGERHAALRRASADT